MGNAVLGAGASLVIILTAITGGVIAILRLLRRILRTIEEIREDWYGQPARPGRPAQPGVMERLATVESLLTDHLSRHP